MVVSTGYDFSNFTLQLSLKNPIYLTHSSLLPFIEIPYTAAKEHKVILYEFIMLVAMKQAISAR
jgi:hypothetical protein